MFLHCEVIRLMFIYFVDMYGKRRPIPIIGMGILYNIQWHQLDISGARFFKFTGSVKPPPLCPIVLKEKACKTSVNPRLTKGGCCSYGCSKTLKKVTKGI